MKITKNELKQMINEAVVSALKRNGRPLYENDNTEGLSEDDLKDISSDHYCYYNKCNRMEAEEVQEITHWDEDAENEYAIQDDYYNDEVFVLPTEVFLRCTNGEYCPSIKSIDYCGYNSRLDMVFCYSKRGIHYFYN